MATTNPYNDMMKFWGEYKTPQLANFDFSTVVNSGRRNAETITAASQAAAESCQAIARRHAELARAQVEKVLKSTKDMLVNGSPEINTSKHVELAKSMFESSLNAVREMSEIATKTGFEFFDAINKRATEQLDELGSIAPATATKKKAA